MKCPKSMWLMILSCDSICIIFRNAPKSKILFRFLFWFKIDHVLIFWNAPLMLEIFEMPHFSYLNLAIEKIMQVLSYDKIIFHMIFGVFYITLYYKILYPIQLLKIKDIRFQTHPVYSIQYWMFLFFNNFIFYIHWIYSHRNFMLKKFSFWDR